MKQQNETYNLKKRIKPFKTYLVKLPHPVQYKSANQVIICENVVVNFS